MIADANLRHSSPSWQVQPALCTYQNLIKTSGCTCQDGVNWRQQVKIFADKNIKGSDRSETSGTISYSVALPFRRRLSFQRLYHRVSGESRTTDYLIIDNLIEELTFTIEELTPTYFDNEVVMGETRALTQV